MHQPPWRTIAIATLGALFMFVAINSAPPAQAQNAGDVKDRSEIPDKYKWDLTAMYRSDSDWEADMKKLEAMLPELRAFEGKIGQSPDQLLGYFRVSEEASKIIDNAYSYALMAYDQDTRDQKYTAFKERAADIAQKLGEATSWFSPELVAIPEATFIKWYREKPELALYQQYINNQLRTKKHTLSAPEERLLALSSNIARTPSSASTALRNADLKFPSIMDENGNEVELSEGRMSLLLESPDGRVRRDAAITLLETYGKYQNTLAALMSGNIAKDIFYARARGYNSSLEASLDNDNIDTTVFLSLIETVKQNAGTLQRYSELRRRALGLDSIHLYDMLAPLIPETRQKIPYDEAVKTIIAAMAPLGSEYVNPMAEGFNSRWIDVYENKGKRSGAYSSGSYLSHPYILLNHNDTMDDMFTVAHEMGHAMHTWHSYKHQPYVYADYVIFVAEVASTFNEALLMDYLLKKEKDPAKKLYLVNQYIDGIRGTLVTQVIFADYELRMHRAAEAGRPLTAETLSNMYRETLKDYYGNSVAIDDQYGYTWARIPHFYRNFYVYKYATSYAASQALAQKVLKGKPRDKEAARKAYLSFLSSGSSKYPMDLLKDAGVDLTKPDAVNATMKKFSELVDEMERLLKQTKRIS